MNGGGKMRRLNGIATAMVVVISASATAPFTIGTVVAFPCTVSPSLNVNSAVSCASAQDPTAQVSYVTDSSDGDMIMTVKF